jgi:glycosyltransferase involved in cell wall biosynthesis
MQSQQSNAKMNGARATPKVSIILPAYNSANDLVETLGELERQSYREKEIIIVDDGSTDKTAEMATAFATSRMDIILLRTAHFGASHARNSGLRAARGDIVFFSETDCVYDPAYVEKAVAALASHPNAGAVCLTGAPLITRSTLGTQCIDIENKVQHALLAQGKIKPFYAWVYRRDVLEKLGGFDERLFQGEDRDLFRRLQNAGYEVAWVPGINWRHKRDQTLSYLAKRWFIRGRSRLLYALKHRLWLDIMKTMSPFWLFVIGLLLASAGFLLYGVFLAVLVPAMVTAYSLKNVRISWPYVAKKRIYLGYPLFVIVRNFSMALGYSYAFAAILVRKVQGKPISWQNV